MRIPRGILFVLMIISCILPPPAQLGSAGTQIAGLFSDTKDAMDGLKRFIDSLSAVTAGISQIVGIRVIILFLAVLLLSAGLSSIGLPRGRASFFVSLFIADFFWFLWKRSFSPESLDFIASMVEPNLVLLLPFLLALIFKKFIPRRLERLRRRLASALKKPPAEGGVFDKSQLMEFSDRLDETSRRFQHALWKDIADSDGDKTVISRETMDGLDELEAGIKKIRRREPPEH